MINLPDVTLIALTSIKIPETINAIEYSYFGIKFGDVKLVTDKEFHHSKIRREVCPVMSNIDAYNEYAFIHWGDHVETKFALCIQYDGFIIYPNKWSDEFLRFDYIGSPWPVVENTYMANDGTRSRVGNGGFSLRSQLLMRTPKKMGWELREEQGYKNEDGQISCYWKKEFLDLGIKYAPVEVAARFAYENEVPENQNVKPFGFHKHLREEWKKELS